MAPIISTINIAESITPEPNNPLCFTPNSMTEKARTPARIDKLAGSGNSLTSSKKLEFVKHDPKEQQKKHVKTNPSRPSYKLR